MVAILFAEVAKGNMKELMVQTAVDLEIEMGKKFDDQHIGSIYYDKDLAGRMLLSIIH